MGKTRGRRPGERSGQALDGDCSVKLYLQRPLLELRIPEPDLIFLTDLPGGLDSNEWIALHTLGFFDHINLIYGTVSEFCTQSTCPEMCGPGPRGYQWVDDRGKKSRVSAPQYIDYIMTYVQKTINDESIFPTKQGQEFPPAFDSHIRKIHRLLFHVLAHVYHAHFREIVLLQLHAHLNAIFAHFIELNLRFNTVEEKEIEVLDDLVVALKLVPDRDGANETTAAEGDDSTDGNANDNSIANTDENKENINNSVTDSSGSQELSVICSQPRPGGAELPPGPEPPGAVAETEGSNGVEAMEQQPPENSPE